MASDTVPEAYSLTVLTESTGRSGPSKNEEINANVTIDDHEEGDDQAASSTHGEESEKGENSSTSSGKLKFTLPSSLQWIPANLTWSKIKPVIRCAVAAWASAILFVIPRVEIFMGQASFLILIAAFISPPSDPFMAVLEREIIILLFVTVGWAWCCLGMLLADLARTHHDPTATFFSAVSGQYIEAGPTVIFGVFIFLGSMAFLYIKARQGPGPYLFASIFGCIAIDIILTTSVLFPYPFYKMGKNIIIPLSFHSIIALLSSILIFPSSISAQFTTRLQAVFTPLATSLQLHRTLLKNFSSDYDGCTYTSTVASITASVAQSEAALVPLAASSRLIPSDLIYGRFAPSDFRGLQKLARRITVRANGMALYFTLIGPMKDEPQNTPMPSRSGTMSLPNPEAVAVAATPTPKSGPLSQENGPSGDEDQVMGNEDGGSTTTTITSPIATLPVAHWTTATDSRSEIYSFKQNHPHLHSKDTRNHAHSRSHHRHSKPHSRSLLHNPLNHNPLHHLPRRPTRKLEQAVGVFESQRYLDLEATHMHDPDVEELTARTTQLLSESCDEVLGKCCDSVLWIQGWLGGVRTGRWRFWVGKGVKEKEVEARVREVRVLRDGLGEVLDRFRNEKRHLVLDPYRPAFDPKVEDSIADQEIPSHRYLFQCYVYQYHLLQFAGIALEMLDEIIRLETERRTNRLWTPVQKIFKWNIWEIPENLDHIDDENPDKIQGLEPAWEADLGMPHRRDPDALPPKNAFEWVMSHLYRGVSGLGGGNALFAVKAGLLTVILCIPAFLKPSASFAYRNKSVWAVIMGQLTIARFRGDTTWGLFARIFSTFWGGVVALIMWYVSCGSGQGSAIGLAAVCGVCFPFFFYGRLYWPGPAMSNVIFFVTIVLVVGYSYQDIHLRLPGSPGYGWTVFWRRFVLVNIGVIAAFIVSFLPPSTTIRCYQRRTLATTSSELGSIYCLVVSFANSRREEDSQEILTSLIAIRSKLNRSAVLRANVSYEFSLRGRWPAKRYHNILEIQLQIAYLLSHLMSIVEQLEPAWSRAFLKRTRFLDSDFQGDVLAVISLISTSLRTGNPLPQITPCPLLDRFMVRIHGLNVIHKESEDDYGLPRTLTLHTLKNEQYLNFCVGVATAFGIITRLDRLMVAVKEIVGEQYHIYGVGLGPINKTGGAELVQEHTSGTV